MSDKQGVHSNEWPNPHTASREDLSKNTATVPVKGGMKTTLSIPKSKVKGR